VSQTIASHQKIEQNVLRRTRKYDAAHPQNSLSHPLIPLDISFLSEFQQLSTSSPTDVSPSQSLLSPVQVVALFAQLPVPKLLFFEANRDYGARFPKPTRLSLHRAREALDSSLSAPSKVLIL
jgi:hypothetical protein